MRDLKTFTSHASFLKEVVKDVLFQNRGIIQEKNDDWEKVVERTQVTRSLQDDDVKNLRQGSWKQPGW